ncbi:S41 family peptidase [Saccharibacillus sp. CPCC 101409]|uniref:S41 family peptidase n=1 Tax=Saccharibacillus sp. CPCC 101409 TaxID=3058041 RepID=UPI0026730AFD|nr:S41 family peptidase [Saccharibacillus sp. CPCC 101409]MDO3410266.1 S41 family peptidase [Saccharibacillus sp. CPCC 101409]
MKFGRIAVCIVFVAAAACSATGGPFAEPAADGGKTGEGTLRPAVRAQSENAHDQAAPISAPLTAEQKIADFDFLYEQYRENYPYLKVNERTGGGDWLAQKEFNERAAARTESDEEFFRTMNRILRKLHNGHARMVDEGEYRTVKALMERHMPGNYGPWIEQFDLPAARARYRQEDQPDRDSALERSAAMLRQSKPLVLDSLEAGKVAYVKIPGLENERIEGDMEQLLPFLRENCGADALIFDIRGNGGGDSRYWTHHLIPILLDEPAAWTEYSAYRGGETGISFIEAKRGMVYASLPGIEALKKERLPALPPEIYTDFDRYEKYENRIEPDREHSIGFRGRIYLLVDGGVFSSAEKWAVFAKSTGWATLVGRLTGGDGIGWEGAYVTLPNSGYMFRMELGMGLDSTGAANFEVRTEPDIRIGDRTRSVEGLENDPDVRAVLAAEKRCRGNK